MLFYLIFVIKTVLVKTLCRTDCYESFSKPKIYIKLSHCFPSGPLYLEATFKYVRMSFLDYNWITGSVKFQFIRFDNNCTCSVLFTTLGDDFKLMNANIELYFNDIAKVANIRYVFNKGFKPGLYKMFDEKKHFLLHTKVVDDENRYLIYRPLAPRWDINFYLLSVSGKNNKLCLITENNRAVVFDLTLAPNSPSFYISGIMARISRNGKLISTSIYAGFECTKHETYLDNLLIFLTDGNNLNIDFYLFDIYKKENKINLHSSKFENVYNLQNIPKEYIKIFIINYKEKYRICPDTSVAHYYVSEYNITYYAEVKEEIYISPSVKFNVKSYRSPFDMCNEEKII